MEGIDLAQGLKAGGDEQVPQQSEAQIQQGFAEFMAVAQRLEQSYETLKQRAAQIDLELAASNRRLEQTLVEREMVFAALPVGLESIDAEGASRWINPEGQRIASTSGAVLSDLDEGDIEVGGLALRVRRVSLPDGGALSLVEDRSQVAELEQEVDRLDRLAGLSELALGIAHEIKNPLNGVMGFASLAQRSDDVDKIKSYAGKVNAGLSKVDAIVKGLLAFARPAEQQGLRAPLQQVLHDAAAAGGIGLDRVQVQLEPPLAAETPVDSGALVRVLGNLFRNAAEACEAEELQLWLCAAVENGQLCIELEDNGPGVPAELAARIFQPFVSTKEQGHGLGLALCCRVLSFLDGSLELSNPGEPGACFRLRMPLPGGLQ